jgi:hypothetical protein
LAGIVKKILVVSILFATCGCANLPDMRRIQGNMDAMVGYMGMMAYNTSRMATTTGQMAASANRMQNKSDVLFNNLQKKGASAERAIQNYSQSVLDNERGMIKNLKGIREELGRIKQNLHPVSGSGQSQRDPATDNAKLQAKYDDLVQRIAAVESQVKKLHRNNMKPAPREITGPK